MTDASQSTSIDSLQSDNMDHMGSDEEENINDTMYSHQTDDGVNESFTQQDRAYVSQNVTRPQSMTTRIVGGLKAPCIVLILFIVLNLKMVRTVVLSLLSKILSPDSSYIESAGVMLRGIVCAVLFFIISKVV